MVSVTCKHLMFYFCFIALYIILPVTKTQNKIFNFLPTNYIKDNPL